MLSRSLFEALSLGLALDRSIIPSKGNGEFEALRCDRAGPIGKEGSKDRAARDEAKEAEKSQSRMVLLAC